MFLYYTADNLRIIFSLLMPSTVYPRSYFLDEPQTQSAVLIVILSTLPSAL